MGGCRACEACTGCIADARRCHKLRTSWSCDDTTYCTGTLQMDTGATGLPTHPPHRTLRLCSPRAQNVQTLHWRWSHWHAQVKDQDSTHQRAGGKTKSASAGATKAPRTANDDLLWDAEPVTFKAPGQHGTRNSQPANATPRPKGQGVRAAASKSPLVRMAHHSAARTQSAHECFAVAFKLLCFLHVTVKHTRSITPCFCACCGFRNLHPAGHGGRCRSSRHTHHQLSTQACVGPVCSRPTRHGQPDTAEASDLC